MAGLINNDDFVEFLKSLGVDSRDVSFDWILNDPEYSCLLQWLYYNIDQKNVLDAREESRYEEMKKNGELPSQEELASSHISIQEKYPGICLPGDEDRFEVMKLENKMLRDRLELLNEQELLFKELITSNELEYEQLTKEITKLKEKENQSLQDGHELVEQCLTLAQEVQDNRNSVMVMIGDRLNLYANCTSDKKVAEQFIAFGPIDVYYKHLASFCRAVQSRVRRVSVGEQASSDESGSEAMQRAKEQEDLLLKALMAYAASTAEVEGEAAALQALDAFVLREDIHESSASYDDPDTQQLQQQFHRAAQQLAGDRTALVRHAVLQSALARRLDVSSSLRAVQTAMLGALRLDLALCVALRDELDAARNTAEFADQLRDLEQQDAQDVRDRMELMKSICAELSSCSSRLRTSEPTLAALTALLAADDVSDASDVTDVSDVSCVVRLSRDVDRRVSELKDNVLEACDGTQAALLHADNTKAALLRAVQSADVCNASVSVTEPTSASAAEPTSRTLTSDMAASVRLVSEALLAGEAEVERVRELYTIHAREQVIRKLWQWFLADPAQLVRPRTCAS